MNKKELVIKEHEAKKKLAEIKKRVNDSIDNLAVYLEKLIIDLHYIKQNKLYYYDECPSFTAFLHKNKYSDKMNIKINTIVQRVEILDYAKEIGLTDSELKKIEWGKLQSMKATVKDKKTVLKLSKYPIDTIREHVNNIKEKEYRKTIREREPEVLPPEHFDCEFEAPTAAELDEIEVDDMHIYSDPYIDETNAESCMCIKKCTFQYNVSIKMNFLKDLLKLCAKYKVKMI